MRKKDFQVIFLESCCAVLTTINPPSFTSNRLAATFSLSQLAAKLEEHSMPPANRLDDHRWGSTRYWASFWSTAFRFLCFSKRKIRAIPFPYLFTLKWQQPISLVLFSGETRHLLPGANSFDARWVFCLWLDFILHQDCELPRVMCYVFPSILRT